MAPKGRWGKKDKDGSKSQAAEGVAATPVLAVRKSVLRLSEEDCECVLLENYYTIAECERYLEVLTNEIEWKRQEVTLAHIPGESKTVDEPRLTLFMSDPGISYAYSGRDNVGVGWHPALLEIKKKAERALEECRGVESVVFNSVQLNRYNGPRHTLGLHADNEPDLMKGAPIASVSFGFPRQFRIQHMDDKDEVHNLELSDGSWCVMAGAMQQKYLHGIPVGERGLRFNLTFRVCIPRGSGRAVTGGERRPPPTAQQARIDAAARQAGLVAASAQEDTAAQPAEVAAGGDASSDGYGAARPASKFSGIRGTPPLTTSPKVVRIDPDDNRPYSCEELLTKYKGQYTQAQIIAYWHDECTPAGHR